MCRLLHQKTITGTLFADDVLWWGLKPTFRVLFSSGLPGDQLWMPVFHYPLPLLLNGNASFLFEHFTFLAAFKNGSQYFWQLHCIKSWPCKQIGHCMENQKPRAFTPALLWAEYDLQVTLLLISLQDIWTVSTMGKKNTFQCWTASTLAELWLWVNPTTTVIQSHRQGPAIIMAKKTYFSWRYWELKQMKLIKISVAWVFRIIFTQSFPLTYLLKIRLLIIQLCSADTKLKYPSCINRGTLRQLFLI